SACRAGRSSTWGGPGRAERSRPRLTRGRRPRPGPVSDGAGACPPPKTRPMQVSTEHGLLETVAVAVETRQWFALRTSPRHEKRVHERLAGVGVEAFLPLCERLSRWKDRRKKIETPL